MEIGIVAVCYNGYGRFAPQLCESIANMTEKPVQVTIAGFGDHGIDSDKCEEILEGISTVKILSYDTFDSPGESRNLAIEETPTEWVMYIDIDDTVLPGAIEALDKHTDADVISIAYMIGDKVHNPALPTKHFVLGKDFYCKATPNFLMNASPFRRSLWEKIKYAETDHPNAPFFIDAILSGAKFGKTDIPCVVYNDRKDSHSSSVTQEERSKLAEDIRNYKKDERRDALVGSGAKLSIFSIVKNEHEMCRGAWDSVKGCDELVIVDTGSTDDTVEIAKTYTDKVDFFEWNDSFADAKNYAMSLCSGDWVMGLDADCRLEEGGIEKIRAAIDKYGEDHDVINVTLVSVDSPGNEHIMPKIFKNDGSVKYSGEIHEAPTKLGYGDGEVRINYHYGPSHKADPDRNVRILKKQLEAKPNNTRSMFYLAREYYYRNDYQSAFDMFSKYILISTYKAEKCDAYLLSAKCLFQLQRGDEARSHCLKSIEINPDHEEALRFMADLHYEPWKSKWLQFADLAENNRVLFVVKRLDK